MDGWVEGWMVGRWGVGKMNGWINEWREGWAGMSGGWVDGRGMEE